MYPTEHTHFAHNSFNMILLPGLGGVHRKGEITFDVSADLTELGKCGVAVVSSGIKSILDIPKTLEYLVSGCYLLVKLKDHSFCFRKHKVFL